MLLRIIGDVANIICSGLIAALKIPKVFIVYNMMIRKLSLAFETTPSKCGTEIVWLVSEF